MTEPTNKTSYSWFLGGIAPLIFIAVTLLSMSNKTPMWVDEYIFYRISSGLPSYAASSDWVLKDRVDLVSSSANITKEERQLAFHLNLDTPIYTHTPLAPVLVYPVVKGLNTLADRGIIAHIEEQPGNVKTDPAETITKVLRVIPIALFIASLWLCFKLARRNVGQYAIFFSIPILTGVMMLAGNYFFYWDAFMMLAFVATLYLMETRPNSKWKYVTACALVNTKMFIGLLFLIPLITHAFVHDRRNSWKMVLPALSILPFYITTVIVTGEPFYVFTHYLQQMSIHNAAYVSWTVETAISTLIALGIPFYLAMTVPILFYAKKYPVYAVTWLVVMLYGVGSGLGITHLSSLPYAGALVWPLVAKEWRLLDRLSWLTKSKVAA